MRFNVFAGLLALSAPVAIHAAPISSAAASASSSNSAMAIVQTLQTTLNRYENSINATLAALPKEMSFSVKKAAAASVNVDMQAMTAAINIAVGDISLIANSLNTTASAEWTDLENTSVALQATMIEASGTVNTALSVLGLTPLLSNLTPLAGSLSCLILSLKNVADALVPDLQSMLDPIFKGLSGFFGNLVL